MAINYTIGAELEFYVCSKDGGIIADLSSGKFPQKRYQISPAYAPGLQLVLNELAQHSYNISQESGPGQYEVQFGPFNEAQILAGKLNEFKSFSQEAAETHGFMINFAAKVFSGHCGNGLHIHYCSELFDPYGLAANGGFMQAKNEVENEYILWAIGGMLANICKRRAIFFPSPESLQRIEPYLNAPTKICWGRNNRSCAIRIPDSKPKRIEHRVAGSDAEPLAVINAVISDAEYGINNRIAPGEAVFGNAWDAQYVREALL